MILLDTDVLIDCLRELKHYQMFTGLEVREPYIRAEVGLPALAQR
jgi:hypothetical protein